MKSEPEQSSPSPVPRPAQFQVRNLQRQVKVDVPSLKRFFQEVVALSDPQAASATLVLVSDEKMRSLNRFFRAKDRPTDVLAFPTSGGPTLGGEPLLETEVETAEAEPYLGDIVISVETAKRQAERRRGSLPRELKTLLLHGFLHLLGYDHENDRGEMRRLEYRLRRRLGITYTSTAVAKK